MDNFSKQELIIRKTKYACKNCGKNFIIDEGDDFNKFKALLDQHLKQCTCQHLWSDWNTTNLGTWPDYEPFTSRICSKCQKQEIL